MLVQGSVSECENQGPMTADPAAVCFVLFEVRNYSGDPNSVGVFLAL